MAQYELYHSHKGSIWKKHKYTGKKNKNGKTVYLYGNGSSKEYGDEFDDWLPVNEDDYSDLENRLGFDEYDNYKKYKKLEERYPLTDKDGTAHYENIVNNQIAKLSKENAEKKLNETPIGKVRKGAIYISGFISKPIKRIINSIKKNN